MKKKIGTATIKSVNGLRLEEPKNIPIYYEGGFFAYLPNELFGMIKDEYLSWRTDGKGNAKKQARIIIGKDVSQIEHRIWEGYFTKFSAEVKEKKIISISFKFNSRKTPNYLENYSRSISFCGTPALHLEYDVKYLVTFPDGRQKILSAPYEGYGNIVSYKDDKNIEDYKDTWIYWTEEREEFFKQTVNNLELLIKRINDFVNTEPALIENLIDNNQKLIG